MQHIPLFLPHHIYFLSERPVPRLQVTILEHAFLEVILHYRDLVDVLAHRGRGRSHLLESLLCLPQLLIRLLDLVLQDHQSS